MNNKGTNNEPRIELLIDHGFDTVRLWIVNCNTAPDRFYGDHGIDWRYEVELYQKLYAADRAAKGE